jgi:hypothetical protein
MNKLNEYSKTFIRLNENFECTGLHIIIINSKEKGHKKVHHIRNG